MNKPKCIYCPSLGPFSEEHAIPYCIGEFRGFPQLTNKVCVECNIEIGKLEEQFCRSGPEAVIRKLLCIKGRKKHDKINPFLRGSAGTKPIDFLALHPETGIEILWEFNTGEPTLREVRQIVFIDGDGKTYPLRIPDWMREVDQLRKEMKKLGLKSKTVDAHVFAPVKEKERIEGLVKGLGGEMESMTAQEPSIVINPKAQFTVTSPYFRAIAKIAFHYLLTTEYRLSGNEPCFDPIRKFIKEGGVVRNFVTQTTKPIVYNPPGLHLSHWGHVLLIENLEGYVQARMQFFLGPKNVPAVFLVRLSDESLSIGKQGWIGHHFKYFEKGKRGRYYGEVTPLINLKG